MDYLGRLTFFVQGEMGRLRTKRHDRRCIEYLDEHDIAFRGVRRVERRLRIMGDI